MKNLIYQKYSMCVSISRDTISQFCHCRLRSRREDGWKKGKRIRETTKRKTWMKSNKSVTKEQKNETVYPTESNGESKMAFELDEPEEREPKRHFALLTVTCVIEMFSEIAWAFSLFLLGCNFANCVLKNGIFQSSRFPPGENRNALQFPLRKAWPIQAHPAQKICSFFHDGFVWMNKSRLG